MNINLRKAASLIQILSQQVAAARSELAMPFAVSVYVPFITSAVNAESLRRDQSIAVAASQVGALYALRDGVAKANHQSGINEKLNELAKVEALIGFYSAPAAAKVSDTDLASKKQGVLLAQFERGDSFANDTLQLSPWTEESITSAKLSLKTLTKARQNLKDELLRLNMTTEIEIPEEYLPALIDLI